MSVEYSEYMLWLKKLRNMLITCWFSVILLKVVGGLHDDIFSSQSTLISIVCPSSCFCDESREHVSCIGDGLWKFPMEIPNTTVRLELRNFLVKELTSDDFIPLKDIEELVLQQSHIEVIENDTFASNIKLDRLDLSQNDLTVLSSSIFSHLINLRFLDLSSNSLEFIEQAFMGLDNLEQLNLKENVLPQLTTNTFLGLHKVQYLNLDTNNISTIEVGTFQYLTNLAHLIISNNPLTTLSRLDFFGSRLQYIDISHVGLERIPQSLTKFVRDLRLAKNNLTHISAGDFDSYPYLGLLVLDDNCVSEIENDALGRQEYLMRLWLNGNCLTKVPPNLPPSLLALYMEENKLTELTSYSFKGLMHLEQLFLQRNEIKYMSSCVFCDLVSLRSLDLQANQIENLTAGVFNNLTQLQTLDLSQNNLKYIDPHCFNTLSHLTTLQMSRVHTEVQINEAIFDPLHNLQTLEVYDSSMLVHTIINSTRMLHGLRKLQELNLMHNRIVKLRSDFPSFFPSLRVIKLSGNVWHCDESIKWLSNWMKQSNVQFYSSYNVRCASPYNMMNKPLMMLTDSDFETTTTDVLSSIQTLTTETSTFLSVSLDSTSVQYSLPVDSDRSNSETTLSTSATEASLDKTKSTSSLVKEETSSFHPYQYNIQKDNKTDDTISSSTTANDFLASQRHELSNTTKIPLNMWTASTYPKLHLTSEDMHTTEIADFGPLNDAVLQNRKDSNEDDLRNITSPQTVSPQRRVLSSRLRVAPQGSNSENWDQTTMIIVSVALAGGCLVCVIGSLTAFTCFRLRHRYQPVKHRNMRRSSSISYYPQKDEVSIVTLTEGTIGLRTTSHHGLGNKLYYIMENGGSTTDPSTEALPDSQLQELLPDDNARVY